MGEVLDTERTVRRRCAQAQPEAEPEALPRGSRRQSSAQRCHKGIERTNAAASQAWYSTRGGESLDPRDIIGSCGCVRNSLTRIYPHHPTPIVKPRAVRKRPPAPSRVADNSGTLSRTADSADAAGRWCHLEVQRNSVHNRARNKAGICHDVGAARLRKRVGPCWKTRTLQHRE